MATRDGGSPGVFGRARVPVRSAAQMRAPSSVLARAPAPPPLKPPAPKPLRRSGLRSLVPVGYRADGETHPFLKDYKTKWLSKLDFASESHVESLLLLAFMVLAEGRHAEAEFVTDAIIRHVDLKKANDNTRRAVLSALFLSAWLKSRRGVDPRALVERGRALSRPAAFQERAWLSDEAEGEIRDAVERHKLAYLVLPLEGVSWWLVDGGARARAEAALEAGLGAVRGFMKVST